MSLCRARTSTCVYIIIGLICCSIGIAPTVGGTVLISQDILTPGVVLIVISLFMLFVIFCVHTEYERYKASNTHSRRNINRRNINRRNINRRNIVPIDNNIIIESKTKPIIDTVSIMIQPGQMIDNTCQICTQNAWQLTLRCGHLICKPCLDSIIPDNNEKQKCPFCRTKIDRNQATPIFIV